MNNKKLFAFCCGIFLYGALFSSHVPDGTDLKRLETSVITNSLERTAKQYVSYFQSSPPGSPTKKKCLTLPDAYCFQLFEVERKKMVSGEERNSIIKMVQEKNQ